MGFPIFSRKNKTTLEPWQGIETPVFFLDESGLLNNAHDRYFGLGILSCERPQALYKEIRKIRSRNNFYTEIKWGGKKGMGRLKLNICKEIYRVFNNSTGVSFTSLVIDKKVMDFQTYFQGNLWNVYKSFTIALLKMIIGSNSKKIITVLADDYFTPDHVDLESAIKDIVNHHYHELKIASFTQLKSDCSDMLQVTDVLLGAILYDLKMKERLVPISSNYKFQFVQFLHQQYGVTNSFFSKGNNFSSRNIRISIFDPSRSTAEKYRKQKVGQGP